MGGAGQTAAQTRRGRVPRRLVSYLMDSPADTGAARHAKLDIACPAPFSASPDLPRALVFWRWHGREPKRLRGIKPVGLESIRLRARKSGRLNSMIEAGNPARFEQVVMPHLDAAYNLARWLVRNPQDAEDMVQEAYLRAFKFFGGFQGGDARAWLLKIVRNTSYTFLEKNRPAALAGRVRRKSARSGYAGGRRGNEDGTKRREPHAERGARRATAEFSRGTGVEGT